MYIFKQSYLISLYFAISALIVNSLPGTFKPRQDSDIVPRQLHDFDFDFDIRNTDTSRDSDLFAFTIDGINNNDRAGSSTDPAEIDDHTLSEYVSAGVIDFPEQSTVDVVATCPDDLAKSVRPKRKPGEPKPNRNKPSDGTTTPPACPNNRISACCTGGKAITPSGKGQAGCQTYPADGDGINFLWCRFHYRFCCAKVGPQDELGYNCEPVKETVTSDQEPPSPRLCKPNN